MSEHALKRYRIQHGLSQEALADKLGVSGITVSRWETGARKVDRKLVPDIAQKTGIPARELRPDLAELIGDAA